MEREKGAKEVEKNGRSNKSSNQRKCRRTERENEQTVPSQRKRKTASSLLAKNWTMPADN